MTSTPPHDPGDRGWDGYAPPAGYQPGGYAPGGYGGGSGPEAGPPPGAYAPSGAAIPGYAPPVAYQPGGYEPGGYAGPPAGAPYGAPGVPPAGYGYPSPGPAPASHNGLGVAGMVVGISSLVLFWFPFLGGLLGLIGAILSGVAIPQGRSRRQNVGMAIAGLVCGVIGFAIGVAFVIWYVVAVFNTD